MTRYELNTLTPGRMYDDETGHTSSASASDSLLPYQSYQQQKPPPSYGRWTARPSPLRTIFLVVIATSITWWGWKTTGRAERLSTAAMTPEKAISPDPPPIPGFDTTTWLQDPSTANNGSVPFSPSRFSPLLPGKRPLLPSPSSVMPAECIDLWVSQAQLCPALDGFWRDREWKMDVIWLWTNGSAGEVRASRWRTWAEEERRKAKEEELERVERLQKNQENADDELAILGKRARWKPPVTVGHFREHDELRYSMRSVRSALPQSALGNFHLVVGDTPTCLPTEHPCEPPNHHEAQIPHWLKLSAVDFSTASPQSNGVIVHPHSEIFKTRVNRDDLEAGTSPIEVAEEWRNHTALCFNSRAIESQLINLSNLAETTINLNDDFFIFRKISISDMVSPLTGPMFRLQRNSFVTTIPPGDVNPDGEWKGLHFTNAMLDKRFGARQRSYTIHEARAVTTVIWKEAQETFMEVFTQTGEARFRGVQPVEAQMWFLLTHYTIERHREALLWSFFFGRSDTNQDGQFSPEERSTLLNSLGIPTDPLLPSFDVHAPRRSSLHDIEHAYDRLGLPRPLETAPEFLSQDGYAAFEADTTYRRPVPWPAFNSRHSKRRDAVVCSIDVVRCFGVDFLADWGDLAVEKAFKRAAFEHPTCGDCIIVALLGQSDRGLEAFLPPEEEDAQTSVTPPPEALGLVPTWQESTFGLLSVPGVSLRSRCVHLIQRYAYTIGNSMNLFVAIRDIDSMREVLERFDREGKPAFLAMNDDIGNGDSRQVDQEMKAWFEKELPEKAPWEL